MRRSALRTLTPWLSAALIVIAALLAGLVSARLATSFDWTAGNRNTLTTASQRVIDALDAGPITLTAYIYPGSDRQAIRERLSRYTRASDRIALVFRDPARHPDVVRRLGIGEDGAVVVSYQGRQTTISTYDEQTVTRALQSLSPGGDPWIVFVTGHGERDPGADRAAGYQQLAEALSAQGMRARTLNLTATQAVPNNTGLLVIASPRSAYLPGEIEMIQAYVARGGALLWLADPGSDADLAPLADTLGVRWRGGTLVYPDYRRLGTTSPSIAVVATYPDTPLTRRLDRITLFPMATGVAPAEDSGWQSQVFLRSVTRSWLETGALDGQSVSFEPDDGDRRGPQSFGVMLARPAPAPADSTDDARRPQRVVVLGDSDFMDNGHLDTLGNRTLALSIFQWLVGRDNQIAVDVPAAPDARLEIDPARIATLRWLFVVIVPGLLMAVGMLRWFWRRRR